MKFEDSNWVKNIKPTCSSLCSLILVHGHRGQVGHGAVRVHAERRVVRSRTLSSSPSRSPRARLHPPLAVAVRVALSRHAATPAMAVGRTTKPSRRPSSPRPPPTPEAACSGPSEAHGPGHHLHALPERRRSGIVPPPVAARRGAAATGHPEPSNHHPQVALALLFLLHPSLAAS